MLKSLCSSSLPRAVASSRVAPRFYATATANNFVKIVEVAPRDGLQNEKSSVPVSVKVDLTNRLARAGMSVIEAGSFVSSKWVPQMAGTGEVVTNIDKLPGVTYQVLVPNMRGLDDYLALLSTLPDDLVPPEVSLFAAATETFSKANTNTTIAGSIERAAEVTRIALDRGIKVRGYVSVVDTCPYEGKVDPKAVRDLTKALHDMGCYEISLGDTTGTGTPARTAIMLEEVKKSVPVEKLAGHFHDTFGTAIANIHTALAHGIRTVDSSVGGLGGCPYSPGATGNVATEDVVYSLRDSQYDVGKIDLEALSEIGWWISESIGRQSASNTARAIRAKKQRAEKLAQEAKAKL